MSPNRDPCSVISQRTMHNALSCCVRVWMPCLSDFSAKIAFTLVFMHFITYMVQLSSNVMFKHVWNACETRLKCMRDASETQVECVWNTYDTHPERAQDVSVQAQNLAIKLQQDVCKCHAPFCISDMSHKHFRRIWALPWSWAVLYGWQNAYKLGKKAILYQYCNIGIEIAEKII